MKAGNPGVKRVLAKAIAALQIIIGALLLAETIGLTLPAYKTVREGSAQITENLSSAGDALESLRETYGQSATNLFALTGTMDDISVKLDGVSAKVRRAGEIIAKVPFCKEAGEKWKDVGKDISSISEAVKSQGETIDGYRVNGHEKTLAALSETIESLRLATKMLDGGSSAGLWCWFVCVLGFCVSMLFFTNGVLLFVLV